MEEITFYDSLRELFDKAKNSYSEIAQACSNYEKLYLKAEDDSTSYKDAYAQWELIQAIKTLVRSTENITSAFASNFANNSYLKNYIHHSLLYAAYKIEKKYGDYLVKHPEAKEVLVDEDTLNFLRTRVNDLDLTARTLNVLRASDIELVVDMAIENKASFMKFRNFGKSSLKEVESLLSAHGITFNYLFRYDEEAKVYYTIE